MKITKTFGSVEYQGSFRDYQRHLLRRMGDRLDESKINLITPPGSGKITRFSPDGAFSNSIFIFLSSDSVTLTIAQYPVPPVCARINI